jgi:hypothetical protein
MIVARTSLPPRRPSVTVETEWQGHPITVSVGIDPATLRPGEVFANTPRGGALQTSLADACVVISIALQHGISPGDLAKSLAREPAWINGARMTAPASHVGAIMDVVLGAVG